MKKWKQASRMLSSHLGAFDDALRHRKRCSEKNAGPYCIRDASGMGLMAEWGSLAFTFIGGAIYSVRAIETPGGDDDRQWLTFWIIMMSFFLLERVADVLLSKLSLYYELKFAAVMWLMFFQGADKIYRTIRKSLKKLARVAPFLFPKRREMSERDAIAQLPRPLRRAAREAGLRTLMEGLTCDEEVTRQFGPAPLMQLWELWNKVDPRYLTVKLLSAASLPPMDDSGTTDAYIVAYLVPPIEPSEQVKREAAMINRAAGMEDDVEYPEPAPEATRMRRHSAEAAGPASAASPLLAPLPETRTRRHSAEAVAGPSSAPLLRGAAAMNGLTTPSTQQALNRPVTMSTLLVDAVGWKRNRRASNESVASSVGSPAIPSVEDRLRRGSTESISTDVTTPPSLSSSIAATPDSSRGGHLKDAANSLAANPDDPAASGRRRPGLHRRAVDPSSRGWARVRTTDQANHIAKAWKEQLTSWMVVRRDAWAHLKRLELGQALMLILGKARGMIRSASFNPFQAAFLGGPVGLPGQYGTTYSRVCPKTLNPTWNQYLEMRLEGGELDAETGEYDNKHAPYTQLRLEVWDRDHLSRDDFIGEVYVRLCPLMDTRVHAYEMELTDPEDKCGADGGVAGTIKFELQYES